MVGPAPFSEIPADRGRKLDLHAAFWGEVDRVSRVLSAELSRDRLEVIDDLVATRQTASEVMRHVARERSVRSAEKEVTPEASPPVAVDCDHHLDVVEEPSEGCGLFGIERRGAEVIPVGWCLEDRVERRTGPLGDRGGDHIRGAFEITAVIRHDPKAAAELTDL